MRGFFAIGIWNPTKDVNIGTLFRSAYAFGATYIFTIGRKYTRQSSDTVASNYQIPCFNYDTSEEFFKNIPQNTNIISIEITEKARNIESFCHPERCIYILGSEGQTLPDKILDKSIVVKIQSKCCLNVSVAGSIVLYDRISKLTKVKL